MRSLAQLAFVVAFLWGMSDAAAVRTIEITDNPMEVDVFYHPSRAVQLHFPERVRMVHWGNGEEFDFERKAPLIVTVDATNRVSSNLIIHTWSHRFVVDLVPAPANKVEAIIDFIEPVEKQTSGSLRPISQEQRRRIILLHKLHEEQLTHARQFRWTQDSHEIIAKIGSVVFGDHYMSFIAKIRNIGKYDYPLEGVRVRNRGMSRDHVIMEVADTPSKGLPKALMRGEELHIAVLVQRADLLNDGWVLQLFPGSHVAPATFGWDGNASKRPHSLDRLTFGVEGRGGVAQFTRGGASEFSAARSVGVRARYGLARLFALEVMLSYLTTSNAVFSDGSMSIRGARAQVNAVVTFGDRYAPFVRAGFGALPASVRNDGIDNFQLSLTGSFGIGVDAWLRKNVLAGVSIDFMGGTNGVPLMADMSLHLSYAWDFGEDWKF